MTLPAVIPITAVAGVTAATAAVTSAAFALPVWAMFIGWVAYFTHGAHGPSARTGAANWLCVVLGLALGGGATLALGALAPLVGSAALAIVVFAVACIVLSLRAAPVINNPLCYFLGLICFFAAHRAPSLVTIAELGAAAAIGALAGWITHQLQSRLIGTTRT